MQERNPYKIPPNFDSLAQPYPPLRPQSVLLSALVFFFPSLHLLSHIAYPAHQTTAHPPSISMMKLPKGHPDHLLSSIHLIFILSHRRLTQTLLHRDFDIQLEIPDDRLCPPVPNR